MDRRTLTIISIAALSIIGTWVWTGLMSSSHNKREENIHQILDQIDQDMGADSLSDHALAAVPRIKNVMNRMQEQQAQRQAENDSIIAAANPTTPELSAEELAREKDRELYPDVER